MQTVTSTVTSIITYPAVVIKSGREKPVIQHHPWVFSGAIHKLPSDTPDGAVVDVVEQGGKWLARGLLNRVSQIQVRILTWQQDEAIDDAFWQHRLAAAIARRVPLFTGDTTAYRLSMVKATTCPA